MRLKYTTMHGDSTRPVAGELTDAERVPPVQAGITRRTTSAAIAALGATLGIEGAAALAQIFAAFGNAGGSSLAGTPIGSLESAAHGLPTIAAMTALTKAAIPDGQRVATQGFYAAGDGGGGHFVWNATSVAASISGMIVSAAEGGAGRWFRIHGGWVNDRMAGAKVDGVSYDDASLIALAAIATADLTITDIELVRGIHRVLPTDGPDIFPFNISGRNNLTFHCKGAVYNAERIAWDDVEGKRVDVDVNLFKFLNCSQITITGPLTVNGTLTQEQVRTAPSGSPIGTIGVQFEGTCHDIDVDIVGFGLMMPLLLFRPNKATLDVSRAPLIWAGGAGYAVNDVVTVASIGNTAAAITPATLTVTSVNAGVVTELAVTDPGVFPHFNNDNMPAATAGYPVTGGTGGGLRIGPFTVDYDEKQQTMPMGRRGKINVKARQCGRAMSNQCALSDCQIDIDADVVYRSHMIYGVTRNRVNLTVRNQTQNAVFSSVMGMPGDIKYSRLTVLPTTIAGFCPSGTVLVIGLLGACVARLRIEINWDANRVGGNDCGQYLKVEKYRQAIDDDMPRGHEVEIIQGGRISGRGLRDSGLHTNIIGTNVNYSDASWLGDQIAWDFKDGFTITNVETTWGMALNAYALRSLTIGKVNLSCVIKLDPLDHGISLTPAGRVIVDKDAIFANRHLAVGATQSVGDISVPPTLPYPQIM